MAIICPGDTTPLIPLSTCASLSLTGGCLDTAELPASCFTAAAEPEGSLMLPLVLVLAPVAIVAVVLLLLLLLLPVVVVVEEAEALLSSPRKM